MKKTLIALAAVAVTSTAFAQNVTISGRLDMGTLNNKTTETETGFSSTSKSNTLAGANGTKTGSRITFAGTEDLGGGLTAFFNIESSLNNSVIGNRNLFVGARGSFGSVQIGRYLNTYSAIRDSHYSIAGVAGGAFLNRHVNVIATNLPEFVKELDKDLKDEFGLNNASSLFGNGLANRSNDTIAYTSPNFGGFAVTVGASSNSSETSEAGVANKVESKTSGQSVSVAYSDGPLAARLTTGTGKVKTGTVALGASEAKVSDTAFMVSYDFGVAKTYLMTNNTKGTPQKIANVDIPSTNLKTRATEVGVSFPMGAVEPFVTMGRGKATATFGGVQEVNLKTSAYQLGANYNLSKRTSLYAATGRFTAKQDDFRLKQTGYGVGIVHMF